MSKSFIRIHKLSKLLDTPEYTLRQWAREGKIPAYKPSRDYLFDPDEVEQAIRTMKV